MKPDFKRGYYRRLFTWKELEYLINIRPLLYTKRVYILGSGEYKWTSSIWAKEVNCYPPFLFRDAMEKYVCYLADMSRCTKKINDFAEKLEVKETWIALLSEKECALKVEVHDDRWELRLDRKYLLKEMNNA